jgi:hypothetical protein
LFLFLFCILITRLSLSLFFIFNHPFIVVSFSVFLPCVWHCFFLDSYCAFVFFCIITMCLSLSLFCIFTTCLYVSLFNIVTTCWSLSFKKIFLSL